MNNHECGLVEEEFLKGLIFKSGLITSNRQRFLSGRQAEG